MLQHATAALSSLRWRAIVLTLLTLSVIHFVFLDDTLRSAYSTGIGRLNEVTTPLQEEAGSAVQEETTVDVVGGEMPSTMSISNTASGSLVTSKSSATTSGPPTTTALPSYTTPTTTYIPTPTSIAPFSAGDTDEYLAICIAAKDQFADLAEWLTHHYHHLNIRRFYIMDDGSTPPYATRNFSAFLDPKAITHRYILPALHQHYQQLASYSECLRLFGHKHKWIAFIDADEFLEMRGPAGPNNNNTIHNLLRQFDADDSIGALAINWQIHTSGGLLTRPDSARKAFTRCIEDQDPHHAPNVGTENEHVKVIVKPSLVAAPDVHKFVLKSGARTVGENGDTVDRKAWRVPITRDKVALHHYATRSLQEYREKIERGNGMGDPKGWNWWKHVEAIPTVECNEMAVLEP